MQLVDRLVFVATLRQSYRVSDRRLYGVIKHRSILLAVDFFSFLEPDSFASAAKGRTWKDFFILLITVV